MTVSIIILTYNAEAYIKNLLIALAEQTLISSEIIIIDSSSKDRTVAIAKKYTKNITVISQDEFDHGGTRARAAKMAKGDILIYFTQDALPADKYSIANLVSVFENKNVGAAYGRQLSYEKTNIFGKHLRLFNYPDQTIIRTRDDISFYGMKTAQLSDSFAAYRKETLMKIGNFKEGLILGEDVYVGAQMILAGYSLVYTADAKVYHSHNYTVWQEFKRYFDIGVFHKCEDWILQSFGKVEGEGMKYIKSEIKYLLKHNAWYLLPEWFLRNGMKYLGYKCGLQFTKINLKIILKISMHNKWWKKNKGKLPLDIM
jgi:rhamnosyltransferase